MLCDPDLRGGQTGRGIILTVNASPYAETMLDDVYARFNQGTSCGCANSGNSACSSAGKPRKRLALSAAGLSTLALTCGVCCVVPFLAPAAAGVLGAALSFTTGFHGLATILTAIAVMLEWGAVMLRRQAPASRGVAWRGELVPTLATTVNLIAALSWFHI